MATTLETYKGQQARNYCTLPTKDVEILDGPRRCATCEKPVAYDHTGGLYPWQHTDGSGEHKIIVKSRCEYCGGEDDLISTAEAWHDSLRCGRCGGETGYAIGD
ncbi:hypothetical protein GS896_25570 [Rhodococcus hoagii]|nr:hypothetical protein [Prescottella equi]MBM4654125.1 hypothetical protein [Prescottella equi]MBM4717741.1 hypothetical protein [Prescottella equi]MBM4719600.1 hypothetical protein [Prescottella equi]NKR23398.1 hypothetical protein [Prescottella equi]